MTTVQRGNQGETVERPATAREFELSRRVAHQINQMLAEYAARGGDSRIVWTDAFRAMERAGVFPAEGL